MKKIFKKKRFLVWSITSGVLIIILTVVTVLTGTTYYSLLNFAFGGPRNIYAKGSEATYSATYSSKTESFNNATKTNLNLCEEGMILLKNENNALPINTPNSPTPSKFKPKVTVFGKNSVNIAIGGSGSGAATGDSVSLYDSLDSAGYEVNPTVEAFYKDDNASGSKRSSNSNDLDSGDTVIISTAETPQSKYTEAVKNSYSSYNDAAIVAFTRIGGEGFDLPRSMKGATGYRNEDDHYLQLDQNETDLLKAACEGDFDHVIVILNSGSTMELGFLEDPAYYAYQDKIDAAIWMGYPGTSGATALGEILNGTVNPSGRTVDTFASDFKKSPTWNNFGDNLITGNTSTGVQGGDQYASNGENTLYYFVDYEEGIYVGYKYYETRGETDGETWYDDQVVYPFGYGLSYTTFDWKIANSSEIPTTFTKDSSINVQVEVENTGSVAGKDVVELYASAPYTANGIEKPSEALVAFAKTKELEPGEKETVTLTFDPYYIASYDYTDKNKNGFKGYELEKGNYSLRVSHNAHQVEKTISLSLTTDEKYENDPTTGNKVENQYTDQEDAAFNSDTQLSTVLSRSDWDGTWPTSPTAEERNVSADFINELKDTSTNNPHDYDNEEDYPITDEEKTLSLKDLLYDEKGNFTGSIDYNDSRWETLLDQMSVKEVTNMYNNSAFQINSVDSIGLPYTNCADGPVGWTSFINAKDYKNCCSYCNGSTVSATWNQELVQKFGESVGEEGLVGVDGTPYTGWYAPGMNIHRSSFGGRNFEYFSEDSLLTGKIAAAEIKGCNSKGVIPFIKHFALNEQETHRSITGDCSWVSEQAMREDYLRGFEIAVKEGKTRGVMSSFNRIGTRWTGGDYRLLTTILRDEWGFEGAVICDFNTIPDYMNSKQMAYAGGDLNLATLPVSFVDESSTGDVYVMRRALHDVGYAVGNSNSMKGDVVGHTLPKWQILVVVADSVIGGGIIIWGGLMFLFEYRKSRKPKTDEKKTAN